MGKKLRALVWKFRMEENKAQSAFLALLANRRVCQTVPFVKVRKTRGFVYIEYASDKSYTAVYDYLSRLFEKKTLAGIPLRLKACLPPTAIGARLLAASPATTVRSGAAYKFDSMSAANSCLQRHGFAVVEGVVPTERVVALVADIRAIAARCLHCFGMGCSPDCRELLLVPPASWVKSPPGWVESGGGVFGAYSRRGWQARFGAGRLFEGMNTKSLPSLSAVQECARPLAAMIYDVPGEQLLRDEAQTCGVKPPGSPELKAHVDGGRRKTVQIVIALSNTSFSVWPRSHKDTGPWSRSEKFYALSVDEVEALSAGKLHVAGKPGDILLMQGGSLVHGSPAVASDGDARFMCYANFFEPTQMAL